MRHGGAARKEILGAREARQHAGEVVRGGIISDAKIVKRSSNRTIEEAVELQKLPPFFSARS